MEKTKAQKTRDVAESRTVTVTNRHGLHARPCLAIVNTVARHNAKVTIQKDDEAVDASSIYALMALVAGQGTELILSATGPEAAEAVDALDYLFATEFGINYADADE